MLATAEPFTENGVPNPSLMDAPVYGPQWYGNRPLYEWHRGLRERKAETTALLSLLPRQRCVTCTNRECGQAYGYQQARGYKPAITLGS